MLPFSGNCTFAVILFRHLHDAILVANKINFCNMGLFCTSRDNFVKVRLLQKYSKRDSSYCKKYLQAVWKICKLMYVSHWCSCLFLMFFVKYISVAWFFDEIFLRKKVHFLLLFKITIIIFICKETGYYKLYL